MQSVSEQGKSWLRHVKAHCKRAFKTIRIRTKTIKPWKADMMIGQRNKLFKNGYRPQAESFDAKIAKTIKKKKKKKQKQSPHV